MECFWCKDAWLAIREGEPRSLPTFELLNIPLVNALLVAICIEDGGDLLRRILADVFCVFDEFISISFLLIIAGYGLLNLD